VGWHRSVIPALRWWREEDCEFKASLGYIAKPNTNKKLNTELFLCGPETPILGILSKGIENIYAPKNFYMNVYKSIIHNTPKQNSSVYQFMNKTKCGTSALSFRSNKE
jgi:hypothetical protein